MAEMQHFKEAPKGVNPGVPRSFETAGLDQPVHHALYGLVAVTLAHEHGIAVCHHNEIVHPESRDQAAVAADEIVASVFDQHVSRGHIAGGVIPYDDVIGLLRGASALVNPSRFEG
jgi:hypothetical protein